MTPDDDDDDDDDDVDEPPAAFRGRCLGQAWFAAVMCSWGIYIVLYTWFVQYKICHSDDDDCAVALATYWMIIYAAAQFVGSPIIGTLTDRIGRRPALLLGAAVDVVGWPVLAFLARSPGPYLSLAAAMGFLDATAAIVKATVVDFVSETTTAGTYESLAGGPRDHPFARACYAVVGRSSRGNHNAAPVTVELAVLNAHSVAGMIVGMGTGELLYLFFGLERALAAGGFALLPVFVALLMYFPETRPPRVADDESSVVEHAGVSRRRLTLMLAGYFCVNFSVFGLSSVALYFGEDHVGLGSVDVTILAIEAILVAPLGAFMTLRFLIPRLGYSRSFALLACLGATVVCVPFVTTATLFFLLLTLFCFSYATIPMAIGPISNEVSYAAQGRLQGAVYALIVAATITGSEASLLLYQYQPRTPFLLAAAFSAAAAVFFFSSGDAPSDLPSALHRPPADKHQTKVPLLAGREEKHNNLTTVSSSNGSI